MSPPGTFPYRPSNSGTPCPEPNWTFFKTQTSTRLDRVGRADLIIRRRRENGLPSLGDSRDA
ncbi:hypothetical protein CCC_00701 [Paramagnetospirillum magnetotacticum MS-1]|uniref:Uncharacterized protein n=1 Tax=Paramagnetospirillum magnetotacticum MS-1 TaxID=272627 RepID=A0A0C2YSG3_PARME|nr:hypothetical protein CCC_00701 [Paramagnetospirillum magnetotacticum MS-1]